MGGVAWGSWKSIVPRMFWVTPIYIHFMATAAVTELASSLPNPPPNSPARKGLSRKECHISAFSNPKGQEILL